MRVMLVLAVALLPGCVNSNLSLSESWSEYEHTMSGPFSSSVALPREAATDLQAVMFNVQRGDNLTVSPTWSCVSLCRMEVWLEGPDGQVVAEQTRGGGGDPFFIEQPAVGDWLFRWAASEGLSVGIEGEVVITIRWTE